MDPTEIIRQLLAEGASESDIIQALDELGIENPQKILADAKTKLKIKTPAAPQTQQSQPAQSNRQYQAREENESGNSLFEEPGQKSSSLFEGKKPETPSEENGVEGQGLQITKVSDEGEEETLDIESMLGGGEKPGRERPRQAAEPEGEQSTGATGFGEKRLKSIEEKVDNLIALTKALQELNKKILEAEREALLRAK